MSGGVGVATVGELVPTVEQQDLETVASVAVSRRDQRGMVSAEWAVGIIAAVAIAGVLLAVVTSGPVEAALLKFILMVIKSFANGLG